MPTAAAIESAKMTLLKRLAEHRNVYVARGAAARLLPAAVCGPDPEYRDQLRRTSLEMFDIEGLNQALETGSWDDIPFNLAVSAYWLGVSAYLQKLYPEGHAWMALVDKFTLRIMKDYPIYSMEAVEYRWSALLTRAQYLVFEARERAGQAREALNFLVASTSDTVYGPRQENVQKAQEILDQLNF
jgi:hypothetical protein